MYSVYGCFEYIPKNWKKLTLAGPKVSQFNAVSRNKYILRLYISMKNALSVNVID